MFKKLLMAVVTVVVSMGFAFAGVDVNKGDQAALDGVKGIGPATSKAILEERSKGGNFKDWADFEARVKGIGDKSAAKLSEAGLTVNGQSKSGVATKVTAKAPEKTEASAKVDSKPAVKTKAELKAEAKAKKEEKAAASAKAPATK
ncbi:MAG: helix-hairpin-helix domain-containing protein [Undibacterium sp.]|nr:helix-hairpin-helix domain-containing protein [Undibacterium sp.]